MWEYIIILNFILSLILIYVFVVGIYGKLIYWVGIWLYLRID